MPKHWLGRLSSRSRLWIVRSFDIIATSMAWLLAIAFRDHLDLTELRMLAAFVDSLIVATTAAIVYELTSIHRAFWRYASVIDLVTVVRGATIAVLAGTSVLFLIDRLDGVPRAAPVLHWLLTIVLLCGARVAYMLLAKRSGANASESNPPTSLRRVTDLDAKPVLLVGGGDGAALAIDLLNHAAGPAGVPVGILDSEMTSGRLIGSVPVLGGIADFPRAMAMLGVQGQRPAHILITRTPTTFDRAQLDRLQRTAYAEGIPVDFLSEVVRLRFAASASAESSAVGMDSAPPVEEMSRSELGFALTKRVTDIVTAGVVLALIAPLLTLIASAVWVTMGRPILFRQLRRGRALQPFQLLKFRTMLDPLDRHGRLLDDDARTPWVGRWLRRLRLDELPQFWNVFVGEMAIIGPRPLIERDLLAMPDRGRERARVRPGITGWAQVNGGRILDGESKYALDIQYIREASLALDARIVWLTLRMMLLGEVVNESVVARAMADQRSTDRGTAAA